MTLLDAAREYVEARVDAAQTNVDPERRAAAMTRHGMAFSALRAAIAREEERQEIIDALVEAARVAVPILDGVEDQVGESPQEWTQRADASANAITAALARYDAMKEDDREA